MVACDLDAGFLERCYETVGRFGKVDRLRTVHVADGRSLDLARRLAPTSPSATSRSSTAGSTTPSRSPARPCGWCGPAAGSRSTSVLPPASDVRRGPGRCGRACLVPHPDDRRPAGAHRGLARVGWQVSRLHPDQVIGPLRRGLTGIEVWTNPRNNVTGYGATGHTFYGINKHHWWLIATVA